MFFIRLSSILGSSLRGFVQYAKMQCQLYSGRSHVMLGRIADFVRFRVNGTLPFERTIEQTTGTMPLVPKTIATAVVEDQLNYKLARAAIDTEML